MSDADKNAPIFLSRQETKYRIDLIQFATGKNNFNKTISEALLSSILKYGSTSVFYESTYEKQLLNGITRWIHCGDELVRIEDSEIISDMQVLNFCVNQDGSKFQVLWDATYQVIETDTGAGANLRRHAASDKETTLNVLYAPAVTSMYQLIDKTKMFLIDTDQKKGGSILLCPVFVLNLPEIVALLRENKNSRKLYRSASF